MFYIFGCKKLGLQSVMFAEWQKRLQLLL